MGFVYENNRFAKALSIAGCQSKIIHEQVIFKPLHDPKERQQYGKNICNQIFNASI